MNIEEIDKWLDNEYGCSYTRLEELHDFVVEQDLKHREEKDKEIERLNNIINELENMTIKELEEYNNLNGMVRGCINGYHYCKLLHRYLDKLQELKGDKNNGNNI